MQQLAETLTHSNERMQQLARTTTVSEEDLETYTDELTPSAEEIEATYQETNEAAKELDLNLEESQKLFICGFVITQRTLNKLGRVADNNALRYAVAQIMNLVAVLPFIEPAYAFVLLGCVMSIEVYLNDRDNTDN